MSTNVSIILLHFFRQPMNFDDLFKWLLTFFGLGNAKFITHTICEHMTNVPLPLSLLMRLLLFHGLTLGLRCTLSSCKFETVNQHNSFAFVCCHAYWLRIFYTSISITIWRSSQEHTCAWDAHTSAHILQCVSVVVVVVFSSLFELTCFSVNLKILNQ